MPLQIRRGTESQRIDPAINLTLAEGELLWITNEKKLYIGDGTTLAANLLPVTGFNEEDARDAAASLFTTASHTNISFTYDDNSNTLSAAINLSNYNGVIKASAFNGSLVADDSTQLVNAVDGTFNLNGTIGGNVVPDTNNQYDLGSISNKFRKLFVGSGGIEVGNASITNPSGSILDLPVGSTIGGQPISTQGAGFQGNIYANIVGADSSVIVDAELNRFTGTFEGDLTGSIFSDNSVLLLSGIDAYLSNGIITISDNVIASTLPLNELEITNSLVVDDEGIQITSDAATPWFEAYLKNTAGSLVPYLTYAHRGTRAAPTVMSNGDSIWSQSWLSYDGSTYVLSAGLEVQIDSMATGDAPAKIFLVTVPNNDNSQAKGVQITETGVSINTGFTPPAATLDINGFAKLAILTAAPTSPADGMVAIADGVSWNPTSTGKQTMVVRLGGNWVQMAVAP